MLNHESKVITVYRFRLGDLDPAVIVDTVDKLMEAIRAEVEFCIEMRVLDDGMSINIDQTTMTLAEYNMLLPHEIGDWG